MRFQPMLWVLPIVVALAGCSKAVPTSPLGSEGSVPGMDPSLGRMKVLMTDAPADYDAVNLVVEEVSVVGSSPVVLSSTVMTVDLLGLTNGVFTTIGDATLPIGHYNELLLKLGPGSTVVVDGVVHPLKVPSSKLHLEGSFDVTSGAMTVLQLDFDAAQSIKVNGSGKYVMQPHIRVLAASQAGSIAGLVAPAGTSASVDVACEGVPVAATWAGPDGFFQVAVLPPGTYCVTIRAMNGGIAVVEGVVVTAGGTTTLGTFTFEDAGGADTPPPPPPPPTRTPAGGLNG